MPELITRVDDRLRFEARELALRFGCEDCAHFEPDTRRCANGYPNAAHLGVEIDVACTLVFCKEFELA